MGHRRGQGAHGWQKSGAGHRRTSQLLRVCGVEQYTMGCRASNLLPEPTAPFPACPIPLLPRVSESTMDPVPAHLKSALKAPSGSDWRAPSPRLLLPLLECSSLAGLCSVPQKHRDVFVPYGFCPDGFLCLNALPSGLYVAGSILPLGSLPSVTFSKSLP